MKLPVVPTKGQTWTAFGGLDSLEFEPAIPRVAAIHRHISDVATRSPDRAASPLYSTCTRWLKVYIVLLTNIVLLDNS